jgi:hypothetical protein
MSNVEKMSIALTPEMAAAVREAVAQSEKFCGLTSVGAGLEKCVCFAYPLCLSLRPYH